MAVVPMNIKFSNHAFTTLAVGITAGDLSLSVTAGDGALFPTISGTEYFYLTLEKADNVTIYEVVKCTARSSDVFTIERAQDGTTAKTWDYGDKVELRLPRIAITDILARDRVHHVDDYGAKAGGSATTNATAITAAITAALAGTNGTHTVAFGSGTYAINDTIQIPLGVASNPYTLEIFGQGSTGTIATYLSVPNGKSGFNIYTGLAYGDSGTQGSIQVKDMGFIGDSGAVSAIILGSASGQVDSLSKHIFSNIYTHGFTTHFSIINARQGYFENVILRGEDLGGLALKFSVTDGFFCGDHTFINCEFSTLNDSDTSRRVVEVLNDSNTGNIGGLKFESCNFYYGMYNFYVHSDVAAPTLNGGINDIFLSNCQFDGGTLSAANGGAVGVYVLNSSTSGGATVSLWNNFRVSSCYFYNYQNAIVFNANPNSVSGSGISFIGVDNNYIAEAVNCGIRFTNCRSVTCTDNNFRANGTYSLVTGTSYCITAQSVIDLAITSNTHTGDGYTSNIDSLVNLDSGCKNITVSSNVAHLRLSTSVFAVDNTTGTYKNIFGNKAYYRNAGTITDISVDSYLNNILVGGVTDYFVSVKDAPYNAVGDGATNDRAAFAAADAAVGAGNGLWIPPGTFLISSNITLVSALTFVPGAKIKVGAGVTVTLSAAFKADDAYQIFDTATLGGTVVIASTQPYVTPEMWGTDSTGAAIQSALSAFKNIHLLARTYVVTQALANQSNTQLIFKGAGTALTTLQFTNAAAKLAFTLLKSGAVVQQDRACISDLTIETRVVSTNPLLSVTTSGPNNTASCTLWIEDVQFTRSTISDSTGSFPAAIQLTDIGVGHIVNCQIVGTARPSVPTPWGGGTAYVIGDVVTSGGILYTCILAHTNHVPPNTTYWLPSGFACITGINLIDCLNLRISASDVNFVTTGIQSTKTTTQPQGIMVADSFIYGVGRAAYVNDCLLFTVNSCHMATETLGGLTLTSVANAIISNNNFGIGGYTGDPTGQIGISLSGCSFCNISDNFIGPTLEDNCAYGIKLVSTSVYNQISSNSISQFETAISISSDSTDNSITANKVFNNHWSPAYAVVDAATTCVNFLADNSYWTGSINAPTDFLRWGDRAIDTTKPGSMGYVSSTYGTGIVGQAGSSHDLSFYDHSGNLIAGIGTNLTAYSAAFDPSANRLAAFNANGGYGGGYRYQDGGGVAATWTEVSATEVHTGFKSGAGLESKLRVASDGTVSLKDGTTAPGTVANWNQLYIDVADGDLKIIFSNGTVKTIATN